MKKIFIVLAFTAFGFAACQTNNVKKNDASAATESKQGKKIRTQSDSLSYAVGVDLGSYLTNLKTNTGDDLNLEMVFAAIRDVQNDKFTLDRDQSMAFLQEYFTNVVPQRKLEEEKTFLAEVQKKNPMVKRTESGLLYDIIEPGNDVKPKETDNVRVMYRGELKDGTEFDSSYLPGRDTTEFPLNRVVKGWGEGLQLIGEGGKIKLWIPSELGYGPMGTQGGPIGPNEPLVFEVELFDVIPN